MKRALRNITLILSVVLFLSGLAGFSYAKGYTPSASEFCIPGVVCKVSTNEKKIALTFDACANEDHPTSASSHQYDKKLIDFLVNNNVKATLFLTGGWMKNRPQETKYLAEMQQKGLLELENHGMWHVPCTDEHNDVYGIPSAKARNPSNPVEAMKNEIGDQIPIMESLTGRRPKYFRSGTALVSPSCVEVARELGITIINFEEPRTNGDTGAQATKEQIVAKLTNAKPGDIFLMHMNHPEKMTAEGVMEAIPILKSKGFEFVTVDELLTGSGGVSPTGATDDKSLVTTSPQPQQPPKPVIETMSLRDKIAQMMIVVDESKDCKYVKENQLGGIFFINDPQSSYKRSYETENVPASEWKAKSQSTVKSIIDGCNQGLKVPLLVFADEEGAKVSVVEPRPAKDALDAGNGAVSISSFAEGIADTLKGAGVHIDFAPVLDVGSSSSAITNDKRTFSSDKDKIVKVAEEFVNILNGKGVGATGKHFPGYGDTTGHTDKEPGKYSISEQDLIEKHRYTFDKLKPQLDTIMMSSVIYSDIDNQPALFSQKIVGWARQGFESRVILTDDIDSGALDSYLGDTSHAKRAVLTVKAGVDMIVNKDPTQAKASIDAIEAAVNSGDITKEQIDASVKRIFALKQKYAGFNPSQAPDVTSTPAVNANRVTQAIVEIMRTIRHYLSMKHGSTPSSGDTTSPTPTISIDTPGAEAIYYFMAAISGHESNSGLLDEKNCDIKNKDTAAHGKFQIMPGNWPRWSKEAGLGDNAPRTCKNQIIVGKFKMLQYYEKFYNGQCNKDEKCAWECVAAAWYSGGCYKKNGILATGKGNTGKNCIRGTCYISVQGYADDVLKRLNTNVAKGGMGVDDIKIA